MLNISGKNQYKNDVPKSNGNVSKRPLHALLEDVKNMAIEIDIAITTEVPFLKILDLLSNKIAIENGKIISDQTPEQLGIKKVAKK